jgi:NAD(P)-dependent dehydrogenase (short-subunit alcohol dehydrogenase family)
VAARDTTRAAAVVSGIERVEVGELDLMDPVSIAAFADRWTETHRPVNILINNAAILASREAGRDARGFEAQFSTSHLGHFQLTLALLPALRAAKGARVVSVSSGAQRFGRIRWQDPNFSSGYDPGAAYAQAKLANVLFAVELDRREAKNGVRAYAVHPGVVVDATPEAGPRKDSLRAQGLIEPDGTPIIDPVAGKKTPQQGAATIVFAATSPLLDQIGGVYLKDNDISAVDDEDRPLTADRIPSEIRSASIDPESARRLWELSEDLLRK